MKHIRNAIIFLILLGSSVFAEDDISVKARVDKDKVYMDEKIIYTITVSGKSSKDAKVDMPDFAGFRAYSRGVSKSISIINGDVSSSNIYTYILEPGSAGKYDISPVAVDYNGKVYTSESVSIEVLPGRVPASAVPYKSMVYGGNVSAEDDQVSSDISKNYFVKMETDKDTCYVGEQIKLRFKFYRKARLLSNPGYEPPSLNGFWKEDLGDSYTVNEVVDGKRYDVTVLDSVLFPIKSGKLDIGSASLKCEIPSGTKARRSGSLFDAFFGEDGFDVFSSGVMKVFKTEPLTVNVLPLPEQGKPANFSGTVGEFNMNSSINKTEITQGDALTLSIEINGEGNISSLKLPEIPELDNFDVYAPERTSAKTEVKSGKIIGKAKYEVVLIPKKQGVQTIPQISLNYFNPSLGDYEEIKTKPINVNVKASSKPVNKTAPVVYDYSGKPQVKEDVEIIKQDIKYIKTDMGKFKSSKSVKIENLVFGGTVVFFPIILLFQFLIEFNRRKLEKDRVIIKRKNAFKIAKKQLGESEKLIKNKKIEEFYQALSDTLKVYIADKLNISAQGLTSIEIETQMKKREIDEKDVKSFISLLDSADFARFASSADKKDTAFAHLKEAKGIVSKIEKMWR
ncbi:BatD family protein [bacterium]|nr:BatD family protein [bacterium]